MKVNGKAQLQPSQLSVYQAARRTLCTALLGENQFYESGKSIMDRLREYAGQLSEKESREILQMAKEQKLRQSPAFWAIQMLKHGNLKASDLDTVVDRADIMTDLVAMYWNEPGNKRAIPNQLRRGLANQFSKFDEYQFGKYKAEKSQVKMRDVVRMCHPVPANDERAALYKRIVEGTLATPDTWEVGLTNCHTDSEKKEFWTRMLNERKLGSLALLRNLRNMESVNVNEDLIKEAINDAHCGKLLPYQIYNAVEYAPSLASAIEAKFFEACKGLPHLSGKTLIMVDSSGSMNWSGSGSTSPVKMAGCLAAIAKNICDEAVVYHFDSSAVQMRDDLKGFALIDAMPTSGGCTRIADCTRAAVKEYAEKHDGAKFDRIIVLTDNEANADQEIAMPSVKHGYAINLCPYGQQGNTFYGKHWNYIDGFSENVFKYIATFEAL